MKKLLVLISIVSLLAFAGSAFGATTWTDPTTDDAIGHYVQTFSGMSQSDIVGHYGSDAYTWYQSYLSAQSAAAAAKSPSTQAQTSVADAGYTLISSGDITAQDVSVIKAANALNQETGTVTRKLIVAVPKINVRASVHNGKNVAVVLSEKFTTTDFTSGTVKMRKGTNFASETAYGWLEYAPTVGGKLSKVTSFNGLTSGGLLVLVFKCDTSKDDRVATAAGDGEAGPFAPITESTSALLGSSGGGCALGTSALALAVLGLFIAKRRG